MITLPPWASGPFELMVHAESHLRGANDFDRSIALIGFDNAIEVAITTYLTLHPIQRGGRQYQGDVVEQWMRNYHTKLDFFETEIESRNITWAIEKPISYGRTTSETSSTMVARRVYPKEILLKLLGLPHSGYSRYYSTFPIPKLYLNRQCWIGLPLNLPLGREIWMWQLTHSTGS